MKRALIIGAGPAGLVAGRLLAEQNYQVDIFEQRNHLAGNCYDILDQNGILIHQYGPHYFRSDDVSLLRWLSKFTEWIPAHYHVRLQTEDGLVPMPISLATIIQLTGQFMSAEDFRQYLQKHREKFDNPQNAKEQCLSLVGRDIYEKIFAKYTLKQWGKDASKLDAAITARIPLRFNFDDRYPQEKYQLMPKNGYTAMFTAISEHKNITINYQHKLSVQQIYQKRQQYELIIYTGKLDEFFDYELGQLEYRSLKFEWKYFKENYHQPCVQINYSSLDIPFTRSTEIKHVSGQTCMGTTVCYETPQDKGGPYYPVLDDNNNNLAQRYRDKAKVLSSENNPIIFLGRLAEFKYYNMDQVMSQAFERLNKFVKI
ncbi:MAG: UDP-galactopyranose/dTDP-fucopyranose mutase family protein [Bacteriovoracia bacterium]